MLDIDIDMEIWSRTYSTAIATVWAPGDYLTYTHTHTHTHTHTGTDARKHGWQDVLYKQVYSGAIDESFFTQFGTSAR